MGVSHLCPNRLLVSDGGGRRGGSVWVQQQNLERALACDLSHYSNKSEALTGTRAMAYVGCNVLARRPMDLVSLDWRLGVLST